MGGGTSGVSLASLSPLTALAVHEALQGLSSRKLFIKWPNDLISDQGKLAGILVEARKGSAVLSGVQGPASDATLAVIGIGINVKRPAGDAFAGAAWLSEGAERRLELEEVAAAVINRVLVHYENWLGVGRSFAPFAARYQEHMALLGEGVCVRDAAGGLVASGEVKGVDEAGQLVVAGELGVVSVAAGEVTLRDPARPRFFPQNKTSV
jgi:BirA family biotin operon repressor/biotin-[acetyl-CoA-carboxylase] ligase